LYDWQTGFIWLLYTGLQLNQTFVGFEPFCPAKFLLWLDQLRLAADHQDIFKRLFDRPHVLRRQNWLVVEVLN
jgi:hypothetical protein